VLPCSEAGGQTDRQTDRGLQLYAFIVYPSVNTVISFKNDSTKQRNPVHCDTFTVFWNIPNSSECRALESKRRFSAGNGCQPAVRKLLVSCVLYENVNVKIYIITVLTAFIWV
jgi:hypothetical protein